MKHLLIEPILCIGAYSVSASWNILKSSFSLQSQFQQVLRERQTNLLLLKVCSL